MMLKEIGLEGQAKLKKCKVLVVGAGGIGSAVLMYLAGMGIGEIGIVDNDVVEESNLHRQIIHGAQGLKSPKVDSARQFVLNLNPNVKVTPHNLRLSPVSAKQLIPQYDVVMDGSDNALTRYLVNDFCVKFKVASKEAVDFRRRGQVGGPGHHLQSPRRPVLPLSLP